MFEMFTPATIGSSHSYSSKFSAESRKSMSYVLAVSRVVMKTPSGLKYIFTSFNIPERTSKHDLTAEA